jgi:gas vesicle protein
MEENDLKALTGALLVAAGTILGLGVGLLLAPQSGGRTRREIGRCARRTGRAVEGAVEEFADSVSDMVDAVEEKAEGFLEKGKELATGSKEALLAAVDEGRERLGRQRDRFAKLLG